MMEHLRPLYVTVDIDGTKVNKILVDAGAAVSIMIVRTMTMLGIKKSSVIETVMTVKNFADGVTKTLGILMVRLKRLAVYMKEREAYEWLATTECVPEDVLEVIDEEEEVILPASAALDDTPPQVKDPVEKVSLRTEEEPIEVGLSKLLETEQRQELIELILECKDYFAEKYEDISGLSPKLVCHYLPTTPGERPMQQELWRMKTETTDTVKEEVEKMFKSGIIIVAKYNEWLSNIVPVRKKNGKIRVCMDYRDLNKATLKDVYPMPMVDMLIDVVAGHDAFFYGRHCWLSSGPRYGSRQTQNNVLVSGFHWSF
ncbi:hypothetical protein ACLB2K_049295 [Fragaria x ananassa]